MSDLKNSVWHLLQELSTKRGITEIIINNTDNVFVEREGELIRLNAKLSVDDIVHFCRDVAKMNHCDFNNTHPILDGSLPDGSRVNIISGLYTNSAPAITIRKYLKSLQSFDSSPGLFGLNKQMVDFLKALVQSSMNILVSGGTGNGKTTFLNLLLQEISPNERIITIEDTRELQFDHPNAVHLVARKSKSDYEGLTIRDLLRNSLRMRPDRIILGEIRSEEAFDMLQAMNTGHNGSLSTVHSNSTRDALGRLENLYYLAGFDVPVRAIRYQISQALDYVIQLQRNRQGQRVCVGITEIAHMEGDRILTQDICKFHDQRGLEFTGLVPNKMKKLMKFGMRSDFFSER